MSRVVLFDVNETLLDTGALDELFVDLFGSGDARVEWFQHLKELFLVTIPTDTYVEFGELMGDALEMTAELADVELQTSHRDDLIEAVSTLPPHSDVEEAISILVENDFRIAALTNGTRDALERQMDSAGLSGYFDVLLSADQVARYKPAPEPYHMAVDQLGVAPGEAWMVAAHDWDIAGALAAGLNAAFIARPGKVLSRRRGVVHAKTLPELSRHISSTEMEKEPPARRER